MTKKEGGVNAIQSALQTYVDRGVFRSYSYKSLGAGKHEIRFVWLTETPFLLIYNESSDVLMFKNLLPGVEKKSRIDSGLRRFLKDCYSEELPEHRRVDAIKIKLSCINKGDSLSISLKIYPMCDYSYAVNKAINLVSDVFNKFLNQPENGFYVHDNFGIAGE